jgi:hypothetical protein
VWSVSQAEDELCGSEGLTFLAHCNDPPVARTVFVGACQDLLDE